MPSLFAQLRVIYGQVDPIEVGPLCTGPDIVFGAASVASWSLV